MSTATTELVLADDRERSERDAVAGFLAGYCGATRRSYATDLRLFAASSGTGGKPTTSGAGSTAPSG